MVGTKIQQFNPPGQNCIKKFDSSITQKQFILGCGEEITVIPLHRKNLLALRNRSCTCRL